MPGIILHCPHLGGGAERIGNAAGGIVIIGRERDADMAIVENGVVRPVGFFNLVERLRDQECLDPVACNKGQGAFEEVEPPQSREFVEHEHDALSASFGSQLFGQAAPDLIEHQADERLGPADIGRRNDQIERHRCR